ncbi:MAG: TVP38/TMEM64 family protein [Gammaproteobacteria bacterium]|nr:TVP38/TMEM64 family protein [Gammaproteobacteria bacterium]
MSKPDKKTILLILLAAVVVAGMAYVLYATGLTDLLTSKNRLLQFIKENPRHAATIFIGLQIVQVVAAPVPGEVTGFVGGILFGPVWGVVYSTIGLTIGSWIAFMLARLLGRPLVERLASAETIQRYDYVMKHKGLLLAFLMFLIPGFPKDFLCYVLGLGHMRQRDFLIVSASGRLLGTVLLTIGGTFFRDAHYGALFTVVGISLAIILLVMIYRDRVERVLRRMSGTLRKDAKGNPPSSD